MPSLKDLRARITSVKSTQKITSAMKMVAASKLKRAQEAAEAARPYAERMERMLGSLAASVSGTAGAPPLLAGTGKEDVHLVVLVSANRGLCGGFNGQVARNAREFIGRLLEQGKDVKLLCVGRKGRDQIKRFYPKTIIDTIETVGVKKVTFADADDLTTRILAMFEAGEFDVCTLIYNRFKSAISQIPTRQQLVPFPVPEQATAMSAAATGGLAMAVYEYEPSEEEILAELLPRNLSVQVFRALLESYASEQGARMSAMDNATRNAGDMIHRLTLQYNRSRQAQITKELIEIISGAEAL